MSSGTAASGPAAQAKKRPADEIEEIFGDIAAKKKKKRAQAPGRPLPTTHLVQAEAALGTEGRSAHVYRPGFLVKGNDLARRSVSLDEAFAESQRHGNKCVGFCFQAGSAAPTAAVEVFFKDRKYSEPVEEEPGWHSFIKKEFAARLRASEGFADVRGEKALTKQRAKPAGGGAERAAGKKTEEGFKIYSETELKINQDPTSVFGKDCPFDCDCCF